MKNLKLEEQKLLIKTMMLGFRHLTPEERKMMGPVVNQFAADYNKEVKNAKNQ